MLPWTSEVGEDLELFNSFLQPASVDLADMFSPVGKFMSNASVPCTRPPNLCWMAPSTSSMAMTCWSPVVCSGSVQVGEDPELSQPASVDLGDMFSPVGIDSLTEMSLSTMKEKSDLKRLEWSAGDDMTMPGWDGSSNKSGHMAARKGRGGLTEAALKCQGRACRETSLSIELGPMEIRTFIITPETGRLPIC